MERLLKADNTQRNRDNSRFWRICCGTPLPGSRAMQADGLPEAFLPEPCGPVTPARQIAGQLWSQSILRNRGDDASCFADGWRESLSGAADAESEPLPSDNNEPGNEEVDVNPICATIAGQCQPLFGPESRLEPRFGCPQGDLWEGDLDEQRRSHRLPVILLVSLAALAAAVWMLGPVGSIAGMPKAGAQAKVFAADTVRNAQSATRVSWTACQVLLDRVLGPRELPERGKGTNQRQDFTRAEAERVARDMAAELCVRGRELVTWTKNEIRSWDRSEP